MPFYERRCLGVDCGIKFTHFAKIADRVNNLECPECGHEFTKSVMSAPQTTFTFADTSPFKGTKRFTGRRAKYIQDEHELIED